MALPQQLKTARATNSTSVSSIDNVLGETEQAIADILGVPVNTDIFSSVIGRAKYAEVASSSAISNTVAETAFDKSYTLSANSLAVGDTIRIRAAGTFAAVSSPLMTLRIRIGGTVLIAYAVNVVTGQYWQAEIECTVRSIGSSGVLALGVCYASFQTSYGGPEIRQATTVTLNTTVTRVVDVSAQWGTASVSNTITMTGLTVQVIPAASTS